MQLAISASPRLPARWNRTQSYERLISIVRVACCELWSTRSWLVLLYEGNSFGVSGVRILSRALSGISTLVDLDIGQEGADTTFGQAGAMCIVRTLQGSSSLTRLDVSGTAAATLKHILCG
jgi:hypothetical protein